MTETEFSSMNSRKDASADAELLIMFNGETVRFLCQKDVLARMSSFFKNEFLQENDVNSITISNIKPTIISTMLRFIYEGKFASDGWRTTAEIINAAKYFGIKSLFEKCEVNLLNSIDVFNACSMLELSIAYSAKVLYSVCLAVCINAAFIILDTEDFYQVLPWTIIIIVSQPRLNIRNETELLYALWMRATVECCRNDKDISYDNLNHYFEKYSKYIEFKDVDNEQLKSYNNDNLVQYHKSKLATINSTNCIYSNRRKMIFPLNLPLKFYLSYEVTHISSFTHLDNTECNIPFFIMQPMYLLEVSMASAFAGLLSQNGIESISLINGEQTIFEWHKNSVHEKVNLQQKYAFIASQHVNEFNFVLEDLIKLYPSKKYHLRVKSSSNKLEWIEFDSRGLYINQFLVNFENERVKCLSKMKFIRCSQTYNNGNF